MFDNIKTYYEKYPGKYFIITGAAHVDQGKHFRTGKDTLGERLKNDLSEKYLAINLK